MAYREALRDHLQWWGLQHFETEDAYYRWQHERIGPDDLEQLNRLVEARRQPEAVGADEAFYDLTARTDVAEVLYSQRYDYYMAIGPLISEWIADGRTIIDFGCGVGLLTTFYARCYSDRSFIGLDRSAGSLALARAKATALGLHNIQFERVEVGHLPLPGHLMQCADLIISTHALLQTEQDYGQPSSSWQRFDRPVSQQVQRDFEQRTGLGRRLDALSEALMLEGRLLVFEKTRLLSRRIPFQRALATRGFILLEAPMPVRYSVIDEVVEDGPLYLLSRRRSSGRSPLEWNESPESSPDEALVRHGGDEARILYGRLPGRHLRRTVTTAGESGMVTIEIGMAEALAYLYLDAPGPLCGLILGPEDVTDVMQAELDRLLARHRPGGGLEVSVQPVQGQGSGEQASHLPLYENHTVIAQRMWERLPGRRVHKEQTFSESDGRQMHLELGETGAYIYLYWANTFDQRQIVLVERSQADLLEQYYAELLAGGQTVMRTP